MTEQQDAMAQRGTGALAVSAVAAPPTEHDRTYPERVKATIY